MLKFWSSSWTFPELSRFWRASTESFLSSSFCCPKKIRSFMIFCYLLGKSKSCLNRVKWASKSVKRLKITAINKETIWKRLSAILYTHGWVVYSQVVLLWWRHRFQIVSFSPSTLLSLGKQRFQTVPFSNRSTVESVFETIRFRTVVVWTAAVSGTKQYRFRLKTV